MSDLVQRLIAAHHNLNREIRRELARRLPDTLRLARLKKERLSVKDRLFRLFPDASHMNRVIRSAPRRARHA